MPPEPLIRARQLLSALERVDALPDPARRAIRGGMSPECLAHIGAAAGSDWLPFRLELELTRAVARALGPVEAHRFFLEHQLAATQGPLFKTLIDSATALFGLDPGSWARWIPRGWGIVFRNCGGWELDRAGPGAVDLALVGAPAEALDDEVWLRSLASSFSALLVVAKADGAFTLDRVDGARNAACYRLRWRTG